MNRTFSFHRFTLIAAGFAMALGASVPALAQPATMTVDLAAHATIPAADSAAALDLDITRKVADVLAADGKLSGNLIQVSTLRGVVSLAGSLRKTVMIYRAIELTRRVDGVTGVNDTDLRTL